MKSAIIDESVCIGCNRCLNPCPVDAIVGAAKQVHTILTDECIGCGLCIPICPVDCITTYELETPVDKAIRAQRAKYNHQRRLSRFQRESQKALPIYSNPQEHTDKIRQEIQASLQRYQIKKQETTCPND